MAKARLSTAFEALSGRVGNIVTTNEQDGTGVRSHNPLSKQPFTPVQVASEAHFTEANQAWTTLELPAADAWRAFGRKQKVRNDLTGKFRNRSGKDCFVGQFAKLLQLDASSAIPTPPVGTFVADRLGLSFQMLSTGARFHATGANSDGVVTEILAQSIPSAVALPSPTGYRNLEFFTFTAASPTTVVAVAPGCWAFAAQCVEKATGRVAGFQTLGTGRMTLSMVQGGADESDEGLKKVA